MPPPSSSSSSSSLFIMTRRLRFPVIIVGILLMLVLVLLQQRPPVVSYSSIQANHYGTISSNKNSTKNNNNNSRSYTIAPGELPGYTGWARPEQTLAGYFSVFLEEEDDTNNVDNNNDSSSSPSSSTLTATAGDEFKLVLQCKGHEWCGSSSSSSSSTTTTMTTSTPRFFVRAYGPAVLVGSVEHNNNNNNNNKHKEDETEGHRLFVVSLFPIDPGMYTLEVVLTFSHPPPIESFPLLDNDNKNNNNNNASGIMNVLYEGYLLPGFPRSLHVVGEAAPMPRDLPVCSIQDLTTTPTTSHVRATPAAAAASVARWKVTGINRYNQRNAAQQQQQQHVNEEAFFHSKNPAQVSLNGYQQSYNSLGIQMDYQFQHCHLMPEPSVRLSPFRSIRQQQQQQKPAIHIIMIGDSVMRLQSDVMQNYINQISDSHGNSNNMRLSFIELYGGYYRTQLLTGPMIIPALRQAVEAVTPASAERRVVVFNTGLHDIHRLCGSEWNDDRAIYLSPRTLSSSTSSSSTTSCINLYRVAVQTMARDILQTVLPNDIVIFQTTSAAWPKYGNYGVAWDPRYGQGLPLDSIMVEEFNQVALSVLQPMLQKQQQMQQGKNNDEHGSERTTTTATPLLYAVDGFWVSYARPDHRQVDEKSGIGKKLSHPGIEVISAMVRIWSMLMLRLLVG